MKKWFILPIVFALCSMIGFAQQPEDNSSIVFFTQEITPEALVKIYKALGVEATGRVAVKISTPDEGYWDTCFA